MMRFDIPGMTCGGCARAILAAIQAKDTQARVEVDLAAKHVSVESREDRGTLIALIRDAGYEVRAA